MSRSNRWLYERPSGTIYINRDGGVNDIRREHKTGRRAWPNWSDCDPMRAFSCGSGCLR